MMNFVQAVGVVAKGKGDGIVVATKAIPVTEQGDCVFVVGVPIAREQLL